MNYEIQYLYTRGGSGVGIAVYEYTPSSLFQRARKTSSMTFMKDGNKILTAEGAPNPRLDGGHYAEDWHSVKQVLYIDSPDDGTIEDMLNDEYPGLLTQVRKVLDDHLSQRLTPDKEVIKVPKRAKRDSDGAYVAKLVRAFNGLPLRGKDEAGHVVNVHKSQDDGSVRSGLYAWTINYETRAWAWDFEPWYEELAGTANLSVPLIDVLSSYEIGVIA